MTEYYDVVDKDDKVIGKASRKECHSRGLIHRCVQILIFNSQGQLLLQKRSEKMDTFPGRLTSSAAGHVSSGEHYSTAATRELKEELGIETSLEEVGLVRSYEKEHMQNIMVFRGTSDGPFKKSDDEMAVIEFHSLESIKKKILETPEVFTPAFLEVFKKLFKSV
ncbi:MAG: NUDIX domain-containing protein [Candidatus Aenigmarchaeota archaeon]|nr:NUDIX domain-containing protein [Candidatus Aenigmarchaeota archaeon]